MIVCPGFIRTNLQTRALGFDGRITTREQTKVGSEDTPENVARQIIKGIEKKRPILVLTFMGKLGYLVSRLSPGLYEHLMTRQFKKELDE
jgi:short-subunit dehydrogenase